MQTLTAGSFYGFEIVLIPHNLPAATLSSHLQNSKADALIAEAGAVDLSLVTKGNKQVSAVIWVAKYGNRHMDWHEVPKDVRGTLEVSVWHELAEEGKDLAGFDVPEYDPTTPAPAVHTIWPSDSQSGEFIDFKQEVRDLPEKQARLAMSQLCDHPSSAPRLNLVASMHLFLQGRVFGCFRRLPLYFFKCVARVIQERSNSGYRTSWRRSALSAQPSLGINASALPTSSSLSIRCRDHIPSAKFSTPSFRTPLLH